MLLAKTEKRAIVSLTSIESHKNSLYNISQLNQLLFQNLEFKWVWLYVAKESLIY